METIKKRIKLRRDLLLLVKCALVSDGYKKITNNIFIDNNSNVMIIKFMVETTNSYEIETLSLKEETYNLIKDKNIDILIFKKNCFRSLSYVCRKFKINYLTDTFSYRCKKHNLKRYKIDTTSLNNITFSKTKIS